MIPEIERPPYDEIDPGLVRANDLGWFATGWFAELKMDGQLGWVILNDRTLVMAEYLFGSNWALQRGMAGQVHAFDLLFFEGQDLRGLRLSERKEMLSAVIDDLRDQPFLIKSRTQKPKDNGERLGDRLHLVQPIALTDASAVWRKRVDDEKYEGMVFKDASAAFGNIWMRAKRKETADFVCMGFEESTAATKAGAMIKSIIGGLYQPDGTLAEVCRVGGITHEVMQEMYRDPASFVGRVFEAEGKGRFPSGALRHPNFLRMRDDKRPEECVWVPSK